MSHTSPVKSRDVALVESIAHTDVGACYQCGKCSAGCPQGEKMDVLPSTLIRLVQRDEVADAARSEAAWLCVSCLTCSARCPQSVNIAGVMDALKQIAVQRKIVPPRLRRTIAFQHAFLSNLKRNGRTNELELVTEFKIRGFFADWSIPKTMQDSLFGPAMLLKGKLHIKIGSPVKDKAIVRRIFEKCERSIQSSPK
ncbi:MAG: 4Fe-4S dicluster domain-containing protein [Thermoguttaceae bacterium]